MKPLLVASFALGFALCGLGWFVSRSATRADSASIEPIEPEVEALATRDGLEVTLADPESVAPAIDDADATTALAPSASTRVAEKQIFGRVVDETGANGLFGFKAVLVTGKEVLDNASTDREGRFHFPLSSRAPLAITLLEYDNWQILDPRIELSADQARGDVEVVMHAKSLHSGLVAGRLTDEITGAPLPRFFLRIEDVARHRAEVVTDDEGRFTTTNALAAGDLRVFPFDHPARRRPEPLVVHHAIDDGAQSPLELRVPSGPTFRVALALADGVDLSKVRMRWRAPAEDGPVRGEFEPMRTHEAPYGSEAEPLWIRFAALDRAIERTEAIEARTNDGLWIGEAAISAVKGVVPGIVTIQLEARAAITGIVRDPTGAPVQDAVVTMHVTQKDDKGYDKSARTDSAGAYRFEYLRPGSAALTVQTILYARSAVQVELQSGAAATQDFALDPLPLVGPIRGRITSETGTYEPDVTLALTVDGVGGRDIPRMRAKPLWSTKDGKRVGSFDFGDLPAGKYRVALWEDDWFEWEPRNITVVAPKLDIVFLAHDSALVADLSIKVTDADNGLALEHCHLVLETFEDEKMSWIRSGETVLRRYPVDKRLRFRLDKDGYPPQFGELSSFAAETLVNGRAQRTCEIAMSPGWGDQLRIQRRRDQKPLAGVTVLVDGREAGKSNENGVVRIAARDRPKSVTLALDGWQPVGNVDLRPPSKRNWRRFNTAQMQPLPKKK